MLSGLPDLSVNSLKEIWMSLVVLDKYALAQLIASLNIKTRRSAGNRCGSLV